MVDEKQYIDWGCIWDFSGMSDVKRFNFLTLGGCPPNPSLALKSRYLQIRKSRENMVSGLEKWG